MFAFPHIYEDYHEGYSITEHGLTKRELFAAMAMQGYVSYGDSVNIKIAAQWSVEMADELIKELEK